MARSPQTNDPLGSGMTASGGSADPISAQFSKIRNLIGAPAPGVQPAGAATPLAPAAGPAPTVPGTPGGFTAGANSSDILRQGINLVGGQGASMTGFGNALLQSPVNFYSALLSGDPTRITQALAPTAAAVGQQFIAPTEEAMQTMPRGGYASSTIAELPFTEASKVGNAALGLQPAAAEALTGLGTQEQQLGMAGLQQIIQAALQKMGVTQSVTQGLSNVGNFLQGII